MLSKLYAEHEEGAKNAGINILTGEVTDAIEAGIYDLYSSKLLALKLATNAAVTVLNVDQVYLCLV